MAERGQSGSSVLARGGLQNFGGFLLRLGARFPFLLLAARLYGAEELGRFAYATMTAEFVAAMCVIGLKRGLSNELAREEAPWPHVIADGLLLSLLLGILAVGILSLFPILLFPDMAGGDYPNWFAPVIFAIILSDITLAALAFRHDIASAVKARSVIEPWVLALAAIALAFSPLGGSGLLVAYVLSMVAAAVASILPAARMFGMPKGWVPSFRRMRDMAGRNLPLAGADIAEWTTRRLDIFILGRFASAEVVGIYYVAQQIATLAGKIRSSFDPILVPMLSVALRNGDVREAAQHVRQVGFWVIALQLPVVLALAVPGEGVLGLFGPVFTAGVISLALLMVAELAAANASVPELALIFTKPKANLLISGFGLLAQAGFSLLFIPKFGGEGAAAAFLLSMVLSATLKQALLKRVLGQKITFWRIRLLIVGGVTLAAGLLARMLPELPQLLLTVPGTLLLFAVLVWRFVFTNRDKILFRQLRRKRRR